MARKEQPELARHCETLIGDVEGLAKKYGSNFEGDVPKIHKETGDEPIFGAIREPLDAVERSRPGLEAP